MSAAVVRRSFVGELGFAAAASLGCAAASAALGFALPGGIVLRAVAAALGITCVLRALAQSRLRAGRLAGIALFGVATAAAWFFAPTLAGYLAIELAMLWLARALVLYSSMRDAALDLVIVAAGACVGVWAAVRTGSTGLAFWCVLLSIALTALLPAGASRADRYPARMGGAQAFADALRSAEQALARLAAGSR